jgi:hypothetical protein
MKQPCLASGGERPNLASGGQDPAAAGCGVGIGSVPDRLRPPQARPAAGVVRRLTPTD